MIELKELARTELYVIFARKMGGNKIRHYKVSTMNMPINEYSSVTARDSVKEYIIQQEGNVDIKFIPHHDLNIGSKSAQNLKSNDTLFHVKNVSDLLLKNHPEIKKALEKKKIDKLSYQYSEYPGMFGKAKNVLANMYNFVVSKINKVLARVQGFKSQFEEDGSDYYNLVSRMERDFSKHFFLPHIEVDFVKKISPCSYLSVGFEEGDLQAAADSLVSDLKILNDNNLILGHLSMPSKVYLADVIGSGVSRYTLFCFLFLDHTKLAKFASGQENAFTEVRKPLNRFLGIKNESEEGTVNWLNGVDPVSKYEIEEIDVSKS